MRRPHRKPRFSIIKIPQHGLAHVSQLKLEIDIVDREFTHLANLPLIALIRILGIILQRLRTCEFMITRGCRTDVSLSGDLASKSRDRAGYYMYRCDQ